MTIELILRIGGLIVLGIGSIAFILMCIDFCIGVVYDIKNKIKINR
jgi:hypothetical protein